MQRMFTDLYEFLKREIHESSRIFKPEVTSSESVFMLLWKTKLCLSLCYEEVDVICRRQVQCWLESLASKCHVIVCLANQFSLPMTSLTLHHVRRHLLFSLHMSAAESFDYFANRLLEANNWLRRA